MSSPTETNPFQFLLEGFFLFGKFVIMNVVKPTARHDAVKVHYLRSEAVGKAVVLWQSVRFFALSLAVVEPWPVLHRLEIVPPMEFLWDKSAPTEPRRSSPRNRSKHSRRWLIVVTLLYRSGSVIVPLSCHLCTKHVPFWFLGGV